MADKGRNNKNFTVIASPCAFQAFQLSNLGTITWNEQHFQCVYPQDLHKLTLHCQLFASTTDNTPATSSSRPTATIVAENKLRIKDVCLTEPSTVWLTFHKREMQEQVCLLAITNTIDLFRLSTRILSFCSRSAMICTWSD